MGTQKRRINGRLSDCGEFRHDRRGGVSDAESLLTFIWIGKQSGIVSPHKAMIPGGVTMASSSFARLAACIGAAAALSGCATWEGHQEPVTPYKDRVSAARQYPEPAAITAFSATSDSSRQNLSRRAWRDVVVGAHLSAIDAQYDKYTSDISKDFRGTNAGSGILVLALNGVSVVSGQSASRGLAAGSAFISGSTATINKDIFFQRSLDAMLAAMDLNRARVRDRIFQGLRSSPDEYSLVQAFADLHDLERQGDVNSAIKQLSTLATKQAEAQKANSTPEPLFFNAVRPDPLVDRLVGFVDYIDALVASGDANDVVMLHKIAGALNAPDDPVVKTARANILLWVAQNVTDDGKFSAMVTKLKPITSKDTY